MTLSSARESVAIRGSMPESQDVYDSFAPDGKVNHDVGSIRNDKFTGGRFESADSPY